MTLAPRLRLGRPPGGTVELVLHGRAVTDPEDWLQAEVTVSAGAFSGSYTSYLRVRALAELRAAVGERRAAAVDAGDGSLLVALRPDERGGFSGSAVACDDPEGPGGARLELPVRVPAGDVPTLIESLDLALAEFSAPGRAR